MPRITADRVKETTTTTGTGVITLDGAVSGFSAFSSVMAAGDTCYYSIVGGAEWEVGLGTFNTTLTRTTVFASSNAGAAVNFSAGTKEVALTFPARKLFDPFWIKQDANFTLTSTTAEQKCFDETANGAITLTPGIYHFEGMIALDTMNATSGNAAFDPLGAGTAICDLWMWDVVGIDNNNALGAAATLTGSGANTQQSPASAVSAGTGTALRMKVEGTFRVTATGTLIPSVSLVTANAARVLAGSYMMFERIGESGDTSSGPWS